MSEGLKILLTSSATVVVGVTVLVIGQILQRFYLDYLDHLDPIHEHAKVIGEIAYTLEYYARQPSAAAADSISPTPFTDEEIKAAANAFRQCASKLYATTNAIRGYHLFHRLGFLPLDTDVRDAQRRLIGLSNFRSGLWRENERDFDAIKRLLGIQI
jgi:hypothetical protein